MRLVHKGGPFPLSLAVTRLDHPSSHAERPVFPSRLRIASGAFSLGGELSLRGIYPLFHVPEPIKTNSLTLI